MKSHLQSYPCPLQINYFWNWGFLLGITIILQIITGIFLGLHYTSDLNSAYSSIFFFIREIYYGWSLRYLHSSGASFVFLFQFLHLGRAISYGSYFYNTNTWFSGILVFFFLMATAFMGYVLPFGQMSFWGATVITNLLSPFPSLIEWVCGGHYVYNPTLKRFFLFHLQFSFLLCGLIILHLFYLHLFSSNNPLRLNTNNKIPFFPFIFIKDFFGFFLILCLYLVQTHFGISSFSFNSRLSTNERNIMAGYKKEKMERQHWILLQRIRNSLDKKPFVFLSRHSLWLRNYPVKRTAVS